MKDKLSIIIPAAGLGRRMKSYGPKSCIHLGDNTTILSRQLSILDKLYPSSEVIIVGGFEYSKLLATVNSINKNTLKVKVCKNKDYLETNVARSISLGIKSRTNPNCLIVYGDLVFTENLPNLEINSLLIDNKDNFTKYEVGVTLNKDKTVFSFTYTSKTKWGQIAYLDEEYSDEFNIISNKKGREKYFGFEILELMITRGYTFKVHQNEKLKIVEVDNNKDVERAKKLVLENK